MILVWFWFQKLWDKYHKPWLLESWTIGKLWKLDEHFVMFHDSAKENADDFYDAKLSWNLDIKLGL